MTDSQPLTREPVRDHFVFEGETIKRARSSDFGTLRHRHVQVVADLPGFTNDHASRLREASCAYELGNYEECLRILLQCVRTLPELRRHVFYYMRVCENVLSVPLTDDHAKAIQRHDSLPKWIRWLVPRPRFKIRCKWCGRYTRHHDPNDNEFWNSCDHCRRRYASPSWLWDSPEGRAYSYYRKSLPEDAFYAEFEGDYEPIPPVKRK